MSDLALLVGKRLLSISRGTIEKEDIPSGSYAYGGADGQNTETITFHCEDGDYTYLADGDCFSCSWVESIEGPTSGTIASLDEPKWGDPYATEEEGEDGQVVKLYRSTFSIEGKGFLDIEYRNESDGDGHYGGSLELLSQSPKEVQS